VGQKINPVGFRIGFNRTWDSSWFASKRDYAESLSEDFMVRNYVLQRLQNSMVSKVCIDKTPKTITIHIHTARPVR